MAHMHAANRRALALSAVIRDIRAAGFISYSARGERTEPTAGANPSSWQAVVSHYCQQAADTARKDEVLIPIR